MSKIPPSVDKIHSQDVEFFVSLIENRSRKEKGVSYMEKKTMGSFMSALRKANGLTQQQVADRLNVSNKTVSKWECDDGYPEITVLPAIAELYGVTVDELLRGERIVREETAPNEKTEKQAEYLFKTAENKFVTMSIVSVVICVLSLIVFVPLWASVFGIVLIVLLAGAAVIAEFVAFMNFKPVLEASQGIVNDELLKNTRMKIRRFMVASFSLAGFILFVTIVPFLAGIWEVGVVLFFAVCAYIIVVMLLHSFIGKKLGFENAATPQYKALKKKAVKAAVGLIAVTVAVCAVIPFLIVYVENGGQEKYEFKAAEYEFSDARTDYFKLKEHIEKSTELYYWSNPYENTVVLYRIEIDTEQRDGKRVLTGTDTKEWQIKEFPTQEEMREFIKNNAIQEGLFQYIYNSASDGEKITFNDSRLKIATMKPDIDWKKAENYLPEYIVSASAMSMIIAICMIGFCLVKKRSFAEK